MRRYHTFRNWLKTDDNWDYLWTCIVVGLLIAVLLGILVAAWIIVSPWLVICIVGAIVMAEMTS